MTDQYLSRRFVETLFKKTFGQETQRRHWTNQDMVLRDRPFTTPVWFPCHQEIKPNHLSESLQSRLTSY